MSVILVTYNGLVNLTGSIADGFCSLLCSCLERYSEYEHNLCDKENNYREDTDNLADDLIERYCNGASDNAARKCGAGAGRIMYDLGILA